jgi:predicted fused transcriptional regulator/phosphomethylpyrimidine kinase
MSDEKEWLVKRHVTIWQFVLVKARSHQQATKIAGQTKYEETILGETKFSKWEAKVFKRKEIENERKEKCKVIEEIEKKIQKVSV